MPDYPDSKRGFLMKGALIELKPGPLLGVMPSITVFQYNPASLSRSIRPSNGRGLRRDPPDAQSGTSNDQPAGEGNADDAYIASLPDDPKESFSLNLVIDAYDDLNENNKLGLVTGIADRLASLEMLAYPDNTAFEDVLGAIGGALGFRQGEDNPKANVLLFYFGPGKIVPIKLNGLTINEQQFHAISLYPIRAEVTLDIEVLREKELATFTPGIPVSIAKGCYIFTREQKSILATIGGPIRLVDSALTALSPDLGDIL
jgi:hypothetical protein